MSDMYVRQSGTGVDMEPWPVPGIRAIRKALFCHRALLTHLRIMVGRSNRVLNFLILRE